MAKRYVIELTEGIKHPSPDRRRSDWSCRPEYNKGERFVVHEYEEKIGGVPYTVTHVGRANDYGVVSGKLDIGKLILDHSVKVEPEYVSELIYVHECIDAKQVLRILLKAGRVKEEDFEYVRDALIEEDEEEEEKERQHE